MNSHRPPPSSASEIWSMSTFRLPDVRAPNQYLIDMGIRPALARRLSSIYMDSVARYRHVFESYFRCAIQGSRHLRLDHYRDIFVVQFRGTIQVLGSQFISATWARLCQVGLLTLPWPQSIDVNIPIFTTFFEVDALFGLGTRGCRSESSNSFETGPRNNFLHYGCGWFKFYHFSEFLPDFQLPHLNQTSDRVELPEEERKTEGHLPTTMVRDLSVLWTPSSFLGSYLHLCLHR